tara:strand:- start:594 stop:809 length:216 start_codon:yes stop_codon:yes gene_type:complete
MSITIEMIEVLHKQGEKAALDGLREKVQSLLIQNQKLVEEQEQRDMSTDRAMGIISALTWVMSEVDKQAEE